MTAAARTIVFFPEGAYGPTNNCVGIGDVLRRRGHRVVFIVEESFAGTLDTLAGAFVFVHAASTHQGDRHGEFFRIAEGSGTGDLAGISGTGGLAVDEDGTHRIWFEWDLPAG